MHAYPRPGFERTCRDAVQKMVQRRNHYINETLATA